MSPRDALKARVRRISPGWRRSHAALVEHLSKLAPRLKFGADDDPVARLVDEGVSLFGFWSDEAALALHATMPSKLRGLIPARHFRLAHDVLTRFVYPHMRPDLKPGGYAPPQMTGFHGQHKDAIADFPDVAARSLLLEAFQPRPGETVLDGGAFLGFGALALRPAILGGRIIAVEAAGACVRLLERNITANGATGEIVPVHAALWSTPGRRTLKRQFAQAASLIDEIVPEGADETVEATTVDQLVERFGLARLDMLSLTINGAEIAALEGAGETLRRWRPRVRLAGWYKIDGQPVAARAVECLGAAGYRTFVGPRGNVLGLPLA